MAENVARMIINRDRSGTESLRKGDLLPRNRFSGTTLYGLAGSRRQIGAVAA